MSQINTRVKDEVLSASRETIYTKYGLRRGDVKKALEEAMIDYIRKSSEKQVITPNIGA